jgi:very-short-patch-repair endonuclease
MRDPRILPYNLRLKAASRTLRRDSTPAERKLWYEFLRDLPDKFTRQKPLGGYVVDFYCSRLQLVVEIDGDSHFTELGEAHDAVRTAVLGSLNLQVLRFTNAEVMKDFEGVCCRVRQVIEAKKT